MQIDYFPFPCGNSRQFCVQRRQIFHHPFQRIVGIRSRSLHRSDAYRGDSRGRRRGRVLLSRHRRLVAHRRGNETFPGCQRGIGLLLVVGFQFLVVLFGTFTSGLPLHGLRLGSGNRGRGRYFPRREQQKRHKDDGNGHSRSKEAEHEESPFLFRACNVSHVSCLLCYFAASFSTSV